jgi:nucleoside-diphosphate-sugar epimerase
MNNILITGGAGYIGSELVNKLLEDKKNKVTVIDKLIFNKFPLEEFKRNDNLKFIKEDVRNINFYKEHIYKNEIIIPLAALVGAPLCKKYPKETVEINYESIKSLVNCLSKEQRIIFPVTNSGYGIGKKNEMCTEESELNPISLYGKTKIDAEKIILSRENSIAFRFATVFGWSRRMRIDLLVNNFTHIAFFEKYLKLFEPHFRRNYVHILDVVDSILFAIKNFDRLKNQTYNLGFSEGNLTKEQLCKKIQTFIPDFNYEISKYGTDEDKRDYFVSNAKIEKAGFRAKRDLDFGIKELLENFKKPGFKISNNIDEVLI